MSALRRVVGITTNDPIANTHLIIHTVRTSKGYARVASACDDIPEWTSHARIRITMRTCFFFATPAPTSICNDTKKTNYFALQLLSGSKWYNILLHPYPYYNKEMSEDQIPSIPSVNDLKKKLHLFSIE